MGSVQLASGKVEFYFLISIVLCTYFPSETTELEVKDGGWWDEDEEQCLLGKHGLETFLYSSAYIAMPLPHLALLRVSPWMHIRKHFSMGSALGRGSLRMETTLRM